MTETETRVPVSERPPQAREASPVDTALTRRETVIRPAPRWPHLDFVELWHYRELLFRLAWRDIAVRYKQTSLGISWAILQPFLTMVVFTFVFGRFANFPSKGVPYPIFNYSALLPWMYFAAAVALSGTSLASNKALVTKVYFPRVLLPIAGLVVPIVDFFVASSVLLGMMFWFGIWPSWAVVLAPLFLGLAFATAFGVGLFLSAINVRYRDVPYAIPFLMQIWMYLSGVVYAFNALPEKWEWVLSFNPMTTVIDGFQWGVIGTQAPELGQALIGVGSASIFVLVGLWVFRSSEPKFADTI